MGFKSGRFIFYPVLYTTTPESFSDRGLGRVFPTLANRHFDSSDAHRICVRCTDPADRVLSSWSEVDMRYGGTRKLQPKLKPATVRLLGACGSSWTRGKLELCASHKPNRWSTCYSHMVYHREHYRINCPLRARGRATVEPKLRTSTPAL